MRPVFTLYLLLEKILLLYFLTSIVTDLKERYLLTYLLTYLKKAFLSAAIIYI